MAEITNVSKLIINYLTEEQYQTAKASDLINENELYIESAQRLLGVAHPAALLAFVSWNINCRLDLIL